MFTKVLLATDFSPASALLFSCVDELRILGTKELILLNVVDENIYQLTSRGAQETFLKRLRTKQKELEDMGFAVEIEAPIGSPALEIVDSANRHNVNLLVVGSRGQNLIRDIFLGNTVSDLIRISTVPTLIERTKPTDRTNVPMEDLICISKFDTLLYATDMSKAAADVEPTVIEMARQAHKVVLLSVIDHGSSNTEVEAIKTKAAAKLTALQTELKKVCPEVITKIDTGIASKTIIRVADEEDITLIIMGAKGQGRLPEIVLGSTAEAVARRTKRSVLLVPPQKL